MDRERSRTVEEYREKRGGGGSVGLVEKTGAKSRCVKFHMGAARKNKSRR
jgi:hypothetical protein